MGTFTNVPEKYVFNENFDLNHIEETLRMFS